MRLRVVAGHIGRLPSGDHNQVTMDEIESALQRSVGLRNRSRDMMIFKLHYVDGLTLDEIAGVVGPGLSRVGINSILNRITRKMRVLLSTYSRKP